MPICKQYLRSGIVCAAFIFSAATVSAQITPPSMPELPSISTSSGPSMPKITNPTLGTKYYTPNINKTYNTDSNGTKNESGTKSASPAQIQLASASNEVQRFASGIKSISSKNTKLSAADLLSMNNSGLFSNIYGLLDNSETASSSTEQILSSIMTELEEIKTNQESLNKKLNNFEPEKTLVTYNQDKHTGESILRFSVNGYNILDTCRTVYFSKKENDGTFLLTGDRKYYADNKLRDETFYFLFKANGNSGTALGYNVQPAVIQDYQNTNSFLYKISQLSNLQATKTGNLVCLKSNSADLKIDLLLDIGE